MKNVEIKTGAGGASVQFDSTWAFPLKAGPKGYLCKGLNAWKLKESADFTLGIATFHLLTGDYVVFHKARGGGPECLSAAAFARHYRELAREVVVTPPQAGPGPRIGHFGERPADSEGP